MTRLFADDQRALAALRTAVCQALERKRRLGQYAVIWRKGRAVKTTSAELAVTERPRED